MNFRTKLAAGVCAAAFVVGGSAASASTFDFADFPANALVGDSLTVGGLTATAFAGRYSDAPLSPPNSDFIIEESSSNRVVTQTAGVGLGVAAPICVVFCFPDNNTDEVDGLGNELLTLSFDKLVRFVGVHFSGFESTDSFDLFVDGLLVPPEERVAGTDGFFDLSFLAPGSKISFGADAIGKNADEFGVAKIEVEVIPLPAAGWMLLAGLGGIAAVKRRRKAA